MNSAGLGLWHGTRRGETRAYCCRERVLLLGGLGGDGRSRSGGGRRGDARIGDRDHWLRRAAAGRALVIDDLFQTAVLEQHVLAGFELVARLPELVGDAKHWSVVTSVLHAGVTVRRYANPQIERPG